MLWGNTVEASGIGILTDDFALPKPTDYHDARDSLYSGVRHLINPGGSRSSQASTMGNPRASIAGLTPPQSLSHESREDVRSEALAVNASNHAFANNRDQLTFSMMLYEVSMKGEVRQKYEFDRILDSLSHVSRAFHTKRFETQRNFWAASKMAEHEPQDELVKDETLPEDVKEVIQPAEMGFGMDAGVKHHMSSEQIFGRDAHPCADVSGDVPTVSEPLLDNHVSTDQLRDTFRPFSSMSVLDDHKPVAQLVTVEQVANQMGGVLSLHYVPRDEFAKMAEDLKSTQSEVTTFKDQVQTVKNAAAVVTLSQSQVTNEEFPDLVSIRSSVAKIAETSDSNSRALARLESTSGGTVISALKVDIAAVDERVSKLSVHDIAGFPDVHNLLGKDYREMSDSRFTLLEAADKAHATRATALAASLAKVELGEGLHKLQTEFDEHRVATVDRAELNEICARSAQAAALTAEISSKAYANRTVSESRAEVDRHLASKPDREEMLRVKTELLAELQRLREAAAPPPQPMVVDTTVTNVELIVDEKIAEHVAGMKAECKTIRELLALRATQSGLASCFAAQQATIQSAIDAAAKASGETLGCMAAVSELSLQVKGVQAAHALQQPAVAVTTPQHDGAAELARRVAELERVRAESLTPHDLRHDLNLVFRFLKTLLVKDNPLWERENAYSAPHLAEGAAPLMIGSSILCEEPTVLAAELFRTAELPDTPVTRSPVSVPAAVSPARPTPVTHEGVVDISVARRLFRVSTSEQSGPAVEIDLVGGSKRAHSGPSQPADEHDISSPLPALPSGSMLAQGGSPMLSLPPPQLDLAVVAGPSVAMLSPKKKIKRTPTTSAANTPRGTPASSPPSSPLTATRVSPRGLSRVNYNEADAATAIAKGKLPFGTKDLDTLEPNKTNARALMGRVTHIQEEIQYASDAYNFDQPSHAQEGNLQMTYSDGGSSVASLEYVNDPLIELETRALLGIIDTPLVQPGLSDTDWPRLHDAYPPRRALEHSWNPRIGEWPATIAELMNTSKVPIKHLWTEEQATSIYGNPTRDEWDEAADAAKEPVARIIDDAVIDGPSVCLSDAEGSAPAEPVVSVAKSKRSKRKQRRQKNLQQYERFVPKIDEGLHPSVPTNILPFFEDGEYRPTQAQVDERERFFTRDSTLVSLKQERDETSIHFFAPSGKKFITPRTVMVDTGAEIKLMIAPKLARALGLTWTPNTARLIGVGGTGGGDGYSKERIFIRLGAFNGHDLPSPFQGCFEVSMKPLIMTQQVVDDIGFEVILGQGFLRTCLASIDPLKERLEYSPAWLTHACAELRCSVPCTMSKEPEKYQRAALFRRGHYEEHEGMDSLVVGSIRGKVRGNDNLVVPKRETMLSTPITEPSISPTVHVVPGKTTHDPVELLMALDKLSQKKKTVAVRKAMKKIHNLLSDQETESRGWTPPVAETPNEFDMLATQVLAGILHPGFGQAGVNSRQQHRDVAAQNAARRALDASASQQVVEEARLRETEKLVNIISPVTVAYNVKDLQASGRLMDGFKLDLTPAAGISAAQIEAIAKRVIELTAPHGNGIRRPAIPQVVPPPAPPSSARATQGSDGSNRTTVMPPTVQPHVAAPPTVVDPPVMEGPGPLQPETVVPPGSTRQPIEIVDEEPAVQAAPLTPRRTSPRFPSPRRVTFADEAGDCLESGPARSAFPRANPSIVSMIALGALLPGADAQTIGAVESGLEPWYGNDFASYALMLFCVLALVSINRMASWQFSGKRFGNAIVTAMSVLCLCLVALASVAPAFTPSGLWFVVRAASWAESCAVGTIVVVCLTYFGIKSRCTVLRKLAEEE